MFPILVNSMAYPSLRYYGGRDCYMCCSFDVEFVTSYPNIPLSGLTHRATILARVLLVTAAVYVLGSFIATSLGVYDGAGAQNLLFKLPLAGLLMLGGLWIFGLNEDRAAVRKGVQSLRRRSF